MFRSFAILAAGLVAASPAAAQDSESGIPDVEIGDIVTIGAGILYGPDYEGSDDYRMIPGAAVRADLGDILIQTRGLKVLVDVVPDSDAKVQFTAGPIAGVRLNRTGGVEDEIVDQLPRRDTAIELGGYAGVQLKQLTNPYDTLTFALEVVHDVNGAHGSTIFSPRVDFSTPLSLASFASLGVSMDVAADDFADTYFSVTPAEAILIPELPAYDADGGIKSYSVTLSGAHSLEGDIRSGWGIFGLASYTRLLGDFADSPIVADRGSATQWFGGVGIGYSF